MSLKKHTFGALSHSSAPKTLLREEISLRGPQPACKAPKGLGTGIL